MVKQSKPVYYWSLQHGTLINSNHSEVGVEIGLVHQDFLTSEIHWLNNYKDLEKDHEWDDLHSFFQYERNFEDFRNFLRRVYLPFSSSIQKKL